MLEILGKIGFDWQVALANFVNFVIIFFVLRKFAFGPIDKLIKERQKKISDGIENAKKAETELMMVKEVVDEKLLKAKVEVNSIIGEAQKKGDSIITSSEKEALVLKSLIIIDGENQVNQKKEKMAKELQNETANLIIDGIGKILKEKLTPEQQENYIKNILVN